MLSDSSIYQTSYSEDERYEFYIKRKKEKAQLKAKHIDEERKQMFEDHLEKHRSKLGSIFLLPGMTFIDFTHLKIKFVFTPSKVVDYVSSKVHFYCSIRYRKENWFIQRNSLPVNLRWKIYTLFFDYESFTVDDANVIDTIKKIHQHLMDWSKKEEDFRVNKFKRYLDGSDVELDSDDQELFLEEEDRLGIKQKKNEIWKRMLPPKMYPRRVLRRL